MACLPRPPPAGYPADTHASPRRYPGGLYALYPAKLPAGGGALGLEAGAALSTSLLSRHRVRG